MPNTILSSPFSQPIFLAVNELNNFATWKSLGIVSVDVGVSSSNTDQPISMEQVHSGVVYQSLLEQDIESIKIIEPSHLRITALAPDIDTVDSIIQVFANPYATMSISTKSIITYSLVVTSIDIEQSADMLSAARVIISLEQAQPPVYTDYNPAQDADASMHGITLQQPNSISVANIPGIFAKTLLNFKVPPVTPDLFGALIDQGGGPFILDFSKLA
jgi:hypothetical protein